jgi:hypothetical protein
MPPFRLFVATGDAAARLDSRDGRTVDVHLSLEGSGAQCVAVDPHDPRRVYVGTLDDGIYRTLDGGAGWEQVGGPIPQRRVLAVAISPCDRANGRSTVYAGTEPTSLYRTEDDGRTWQPCPDLSLLPSAPTWYYPPRPWTHHVRTIAFHPADPATLYVGVEVGGVMVSRDRGVTWEDRKPVAQVDAHTLATHATAPDRLYEAAGDGVALSADAGATWRSVDDGMDRHYAWGLAVDAADPDLWYVSASPSAEQGHRLDGIADAAAVLFRKRGEAPWQPLGGEGSVLARPHPVLPFALLAPRRHPNALIAGMHDGDILVTDAGETWRRLHTGLSRLLAASEATE